MNPITERLDKVASSLESKGFIQEATEIDLISNTIEKLSYRVEADPVYKSIALSLQALKKGKAKSAFAFLDNIAKAMENRATQYKDIQAVQQAFSMFQAAREALKSDNVDPNQVARFLVEAQGYFEKAEPEISQAQMRPQKYQPMDLVFSAK
jgi:hypothetical protein